MQMQKIPLGIVHGRFQPPHNGHIRFMQEAFKRAEHVIIGICTPTICTDAEAERTGYPCAPHMNPFTHQERAEMITLALSEAGIETSRYSFLPFPSDYKNIESFVPADTVFFMSVTSEHDQKKIAHLESKIFRVDTIFELPEDNNREKGSVIRTKGKNWEQMIPESIMKYMKKHNMIE
jgi:cytidyltransferase-like protein